MTTHHRPLHTLFAFLIVLITLSFSPIAAVPVGAETDWFAARPVRFAPRYRCLDEAIRIDPAQPIECDGPTAEDPNGPISEDPVTPKQIDCASKDLTVTVSNVTRTDNGGRYTVKYHVVVKCAGKVITVNYEGRDHTSGFTPDILEKLQPDAQGTAKNGARAFKLDPQGSTVTITVVGSDGKEVSSDAQKIP